MYLLLFYKKCIPFISVLFSRCRLRSGEWGGWWVEGGVLYSFRLLHTSLHFARKTPLKARPSLPPFGLPLFTIYLGRTRIVIFSDFQRSIPPSSKIIRNTRYCTRVCNIMYMMHALWCVPRLKMTRRYNIMYKIIINNDIANENIVYILIYSSTVYYMSSVYSRNVRIPTTTSTFKRNEIRLNVV